MSWIPPLLVAIPLLSAAVIAGGDHVTPSRIQQTIAVCAAGAATVLALLLLVESQAHEAVYWFGGWQPRHGVAIGVDFTVDPLGAGMCAVAATVVLGALLYSLTYMKEEARLFDALMLVALGAICGFALAGDIFDMFVWLELTSVAAYALTGFKVEQLGPIQGAFNFGIVNTVGGYLFVIGLALLYARTGALNLAQIGRQLTGSAANGLVIVALTLVVCGLLTKAAAVPFHLWAADAYAVAPAPVCMVLGGVVTDIGLLGVARIYWTVFDAPFGAHARFIGDLLLWVGVVSGLLGGVMALLQRHLKRMLAYSVVCHIGIMLAGVGLLSTKGLAGTAGVFLAHAFLTGSLFLVCGVLLTHRGSIDELVLRGRPGRDRLLAAIWFLAALGLVGAPYLGVYLGHALVDEAASAASRDWIPPLLWLSGALASAALIRAGGRIFLRLGADEAPLLGPHLQEDPADRTVHRPLLVTIAAFTATLGLLVSIVPGLGQRLEQGAERFRDRSAYAARVLESKPAPLPPRPASVLLHTGAETLLYSAGATLLAALLGVAGLVRLPETLRGRGRPLLTVPVTVLKAVHSGVVGDYVAWLTFGTALFGGVWALTLR